MKKLLYVALLVIGVVVMMTPPVMAQEEKPFTIHGEVRFRGEYNKNASDFDSDTGDSGSYWPYRVRIAAEGRFAHNVTAWIEFQNAGVSGGPGVFGFTPDGVTRTGSDLLGLTGSGVEMYQGNISFGKLWWNGFAGRLGRQEIVAGNELMLGDLDFYAGLTHDAMVGDWKLKKGALKFIASRPVQGSGVDVIAAAFLPPDQVDQTDSGFISTPTTMNFYGVYTTWDVGMGMLDAYILDLKSHGGGANFDVMTLGVRWGRDIMNKSGIFWNVEYAQQSGDALGSSGCDPLEPSCDAKGNVTEAWIGWNLKSGKSNHRFYAKLEAASGDDDGAPAGGNRDEDGFIPMFGDFHNRLGHGDWFRLSGNPTFLGSNSVAGGVGDQGIQGLAVGWNGVFGEKNELGAEFWQYSADKENATGDDKLGNALDVWYGYNYSRNLAFTAAVSQLSPDDGLTGGGGVPDDKVMRVYANARLRF